VEQVGHGNGNNLIRVDERFHISALLRATRGRHSVPPVAMPVSTVVWITLPAGEVPP